MSIPKNKSEMFTYLLGVIGDVLSNAGGNDMDVANTPENYALIEMSAVRNLGCASLERFRSHPEYENYKPRISKDGKTINTSDYVILEIMKAELGLNNKS